MEQEQQSVDAGAAAVKEHDDAIAPHDAALQQAHTDAKAELVDRVHGASTYEEVKQLLADCEQAFRDAQARYDEAAAPIKQRFAEAITAAGALTSDDR